MRTRSKDIIMQNKVFARVAIAIAAVLLIPLIAMQFSNEVHWTLEDFVAIGILLFGSGSLFVLAARKWQTRRVTIGIAIALAFLYIWAELAVGIFTDLGS